MNNISEKLKNMTKEQITKEAEKQLMEGVKRKTKELEYREGRVPTSRGFTDGSYRHRKISDKVYERMIKIRDILRKLGGATIRRVLYVMYPELGKKKLENKYQQTIKDCVRGRLQGVIPWDLIKESGRKVHECRAFKNTDNFIKWFEVKDMAWEYDLDKSSSHIGYFEVWLEKEGLAEDFEEVCDRYDVPFLALKGQSSWTAIKEASDRLKKLNATILYFGDNDEYGNDMFERYKGFLQELGCSTEFFKIALTEEQEKEWNLPEGAKIDGVDTESLMEILEESILEYIDSKKYEKLYLQERKDKRKLAKYKIKVMKNNMGFLIAIVVIYILLNIWALIWNDLPKR